MVKYQGASAGVSEIIMIIAFIAGLIIVFYVLAKKEIGNLGKGLSDSVKGLIPDISFPDISFPDPTKLLGKKPMTEAERLEVLSHRLGGEHDTPLSGEALKRFQAWDVDMYTNRTLEEAVIANPTFFGYGQVEGESGSRAVTTEEAKQLLSGWTNIWK